jgi:putative transport protein
MRWLVDSLRAHPELAFFLTLAIGYLAGRVRIGTFQLGSVVGVLLAGIAVGQLDVAISGQLKNAFFLLFLFSIGFKTGPQFFRGLRSSGLPQIGVTLVLTVTALGVAWGISRLLGFDAGTAGGLVAGAMTDSAALGTAGDAIAKLGVSEAVTRELTANSAVAFAVTYLIGMIEVTWLLSWLGPRLMRVDIAKACADLEAELGIVRNEPGVVSAYFHFVMRAYSIPAHLAGKSVKELEESFGSARVFVERVRRGSILEAQPELVLRERDRIVLSGRHEALVAAANPLGAFEVEDAELLDIPSIRVDVVVTDKAVVGETLETLAQSASTRGVFARKLVRGGEELPFGPRSRLERGDVVTLTGAKERIERVASELGHAQWPTDATDLGPVASSIVIGSLVGLPALMFGRLEIGLSMFVGALLGGLVFGWLQSTHPRLGRVPAPALWLFDSIGLAGFLAVVGMDAGPDFVRGVSQSGVALVGGALVLTAVPHVVAIVTGRYLFGLHPGLVLGVCAGAGSSAPALAAVQEVANSKVPALAYGVSYAVGNVVLALWGSVIVLLIGAG